MIPVYPGSLISVTCFRTKLEDGNQETVPNSLCLGSWRRKCLHRHQWGDGNTTSVGGGWHISGKVPRSSFVLLYSVILPTNKCQLLSKTKCKSFECNHKLLGCLQWYSQVTTSLGQGRYEYCFSVDGAWTHDPDLPTIKNDQVTEKQFCLRENMFLSGALQQPAQDCGCKGSCGKQEF